jgi:drug/metabolite transporter (DMT)-like permease
VGLIVVASLLLSSGEQQLPLAAGLVALACLSWGLDNNFTALIGTYTPAQVAFAKGLVGASVNWGVASLIAPPSPASVWTLAQVIFVGALGYGASLVLYVSSAQQLGATRSQLIFSSAPAWGLLLAWLALGEEIRTVQLLAAALMGLALWVWHQERHAHRHTHHAVTHTHWHRHDDGHHSHHPHQQRRTWHSHEHSHRAETHAHSHLPDLHHRHRHGA